MVLAAEGDDVEVDAEAEAAGLAQTLEEEEGGDEEAAEDSGEFNPTYEDVLDLTIKAFKT